MELQNTKGIDTIPANIFWILIVMQKIWMD